MTAAETMHVAADQADWGEELANILIVDDRRENLLALEEILLPLGHRVVRAQSGDEALKRLLTDDFAVILLDVRMPDLDGLETATHIKRREKSRHIPIIFLTAASEEPREILRGYSAGAVDYLSKPFDPWVLRAKVAVFVDLHLERKRAQELSRRLSEAEVRRRHALEINDTVVQGLSVAKLALELGDQEMGRQVVADTLDSARRIMSQLLPPGEGRTVKPGDLVRRTPAG